MVQPSGRQFSSSQAVICVCRWPRPCGGTPILMRTGKRRSAVVIISRGLPGNLNVPYIFSSRLPRPLGAVQPVERTESLRARESFREKIESSSIAGATLVTRNCETGRPFLRRTCGLGHPLSGGAGRQEWNQVGDRRLAKASLPAYTSNSANSSPRASVRNRLADPDELPDKMSNGQSGGTIFGLPGGLKLQFSAPQSRDTASSPFVTSPSTVFVPSEHR